MLLYILLFFDRFSLIFLFCGGAVHVPETRDKASFRVNYTVPLKSTLLYPHKDGVQWQDNWLCNVISAKLDMFFKFNFPCICCSTWSKMSTSYKKHYYALGKKDYMLQQQSTHINNPYLPLHLLLFQPEFRLDFSMRSIGKFIIQSFVFHIFLQCCVFCLYIRCALRQHLQQTSHSCVSFQHPA